MGPYHKILLEDVSVSQNTPTLTINLSNSNNTYRIGEEEISFSPFVTFSNFDKSLMMKGKKVYDHGG